MKKIDTLLVRSFIPPLITWTMVTMFIFNMQFLWKYIDDIVGKGLELSVVFELLFYQAIAMLPRALVLGITIASVMTMGNLAEHYELVTLKSAGVSLFRIMRPLIIFCAFIAMGSFIFADQLIPIAALKFKARLYDIRRQKPTLTLEKGQFNNDFKTMALYIGDKDADGKNLTDIKIYDHSQNKGNASQTNAKNGQLYYLKDTIVEKINIPGAPNEPPTTKDTIVHKSYLVVRLLNGHRYEEMEQSNKRPSLYPHMRMSFKSYTSMFDMSEFEFNETKEDLFKNHHSLMTTKQLKKAIDSLADRRTGRMEDLVKHTNSLYHYRRIGSDRPDTSDLPARKYTPIARMEQKIFDVNPDTTTIILAAMIDASKRDYLYQRAIGFAQNIKSQASNSSKYYDKNKVDHIKHENEIHQKLSYSLACLLFLFIGAPMGAIIRKGGFGIPILVAFIFFMIFFVLYMVGERMAEGLALPCWLGAWLPNVALFPISVLLTYKAVNDSPLFRTDKIKAFFSRLFGRFKKQKE
ncbi:MAG: YjgP/YjgQ family permease [Aureispira sp.]|nr:YjgP/YjgQ family permease [Aureispira sp.]